MGTNTPKLRPYKRTVPIKGEPRDLVVERIRPYIGPLLANGSFYFNYSDGDLTPLAGTCVICMAHLPYWRWTRDMCVGCDFESLPEDGPDDNPVQGPDYLGPNLGEY